VIPFDPKLGSGIGLLAAVIDDKVQLVCVVTDDLVAAKKAEAGKIVGAIAKMIGRRRRRAAASCNGQEEKIFKN